MRRSENGVITREQFEEIKKKEQKKDARGSVVI